MKSVFNSIVLHEDTDATMCYFIKLVENCSSNRVLRRRIGLYASVWWRSI